MLPKWVDVNEWVAINSEHMRLRSECMLTILVSVYDFYTNLNMFYGTLTEFCTLTACSTMAAGNTYVHRPSI